MANLTASIKRAPKWAWYVGGGLALGAVGIEVWKRRATDTPSPTDATNAATTVGTPGVATAAPSPVITPPVIIQPNDSSPDFTGLFGVFGDALNNAVGTVGQLAAGDQGITQSAVGVIGNLAAGDQDIARTAVANAGQAPAPAAQVSPIIVSVPAPITTPSIGAKVAACPSTFPHRSTRGCHRCERKSDGTYTHIYQNGARVGGNKTC